MTSISERHRAGQFLEKLSRVTSSGQIIPEIDGLRFVAIMAVVAYHLGYFIAVGYPALWITPGENPWNTHMVARGRYGVELFFVISGFVLSLPFAAHYRGKAPKVGLKRYFIRRLARIAPPYLLVLFVIFAGKVWFLERDPADLFPHLLSSLFYVHGLVYAHGSVIVPVAWTLEIEMQFYLSMPVLGFLFAVRRPPLRRLVLAAFGLACIICQIVFIPHGSVLSFTLANNLQYFLVGFLLADVYLDEWKEPCPHEWRWDFMALGMGLLSLYLAPGQPELGRLLLPFILFLFCFAAFRGVLVHWLLRVPWVTLIGGMCYSIYLIHYFFLPIALRYTHEVLFAGTFTGNLVVQFLIVVPLLLAMSAVFYVFVERPCMRQGRPDRAVPRTHPAI